MVKAKIVRIGNSQGIRLPRTIIEQLGLEGEVELEIGENELLIRRGNVPRAGWETVFSQMSRNKDDTLLDGELIRSEWDDKEWTW